MSLHDVAHLLFLRVAQVQLTKCEAGVEAAARAAARPERRSVSSGPAPGCTLREERHGAARHEGDNSRRHNNLTNTIHGYSLQTLVRLKPDPTDSAFNQSDVASRVEVGLARVKNP